MAVRRSKDVSHAVVDLLMAYVGLMVGAAKAII